MVSEVETETGTCERRERKVSGDGAVTFGERSTWHYVIRQDLAAVIFWKLRGDHWLDFELAEIQGEEADGSLCFTATGDSAGVGCAMQDAYPEYSGYVKWDGCAEFDLSPHVCGRQDLERINATMLAAYDLGKAHVPDWDGDD